MGLEGGGRRETQWCNHGKNSHQCLLGSTASPSCHPCVCVCVCVCASLFLYLQGYKWNKRHEKFKGSIFNVKLFIFYKGAPVFVLLRLVNSHLN